jgi:HD-like signal output (HDOD) protein
MVVHKIVPRLFTYGREHKMKTVIFFLFVLTCCVIYFYFLKNRNAQPPPNKKDTVRSKGFSPPAATKDATPQSLNVPEKPLDRIGPLRSHVSDGIKIILSSYRLEDPISSLPLQRPEIKPDVVAKVKNHIGDMKEFSSFDELSRLLDDPNVDMSKISKKISMDPVLSNKILKVANSAYFGSNVSVDSINHALALLGLINIKAIMFHNAFSKKLAGSKIQNHPIYQSLWGHAISTATCAFYLSEAFDGLNKGKLYTLGLVHDIGKFIIPEMSGTKNVDDYFMIPYGDKSCIIREDSSFGINHAVIGRIAFENSGLSEQLLKLIEYHHLPSFSSKSSFESKEEDKRYLSALYLANQIAKLFAGEEERSFFSIQPLPFSFGDFVDRSKLEKIFSDERVLSEIAKTKSLTESYIRP